VSKYLESLIAEGEHQRQDFKYCISDARKIARSISAFANTDGGRLLIGIRDNGSVAGVSSDEEYYMIESAAALYCKPEVEFSTDIRKTDSKTVFIITIPTGNQKPYLAQQEDGRWLAYIRRDDQNLLANKVILNTWKLRKDNKDLFIEFRKAESLLISYLKKNESISLSKFIKISGLRKSRAEWILAKLIVLGTLSYDLSEEGCKYLPSRS